MICVSVTERTLGFGLCCVSERCGEQGMGLDTDRRFGAALMVDLL